MKTRTVALCRERPVCAHAMPTPCLRHAYAHNHANARVHERTAHGLFDRHVALGAQVGAASEPMVDARRVKQVPTWQSAHALFACKWLEADTACLRAHSVGCRNDPAWAELVEALPAESLGLDG